MKIVADLHTHTVASSHAYSTVEEICRWAKKNHLKAVAICDHGPAMEGGAHIYHFTNLRCLPRELEGVRILRGAEANILTEEGALDLPDGILKNLDVVIAAFHDGINLMSHSLEKNTLIMINAMKNPYVHIIAHPENPLFPVDIKKTVAAAKQYGKIVEINNASLTVARLGSGPQLRQLIQELKKQQVPAVVNSDAHIGMRVGDFAAALKMMAEEDFPAELVVNSSLVKLTKALNLKSR
jgi:putative hydrolase